MSLLKILVAMGNPEFPSGKSKTSVYRFRERRVNETGLGGLGLGVDVANEN